MPPAGLTWTDVRQAVSADRMRAGIVGRGLGRRRASQNRDVTPAAWLTRAWLTRVDGRAGGYKQSRRRAAWRLVYYNNCLCGSVEIAVVPVREEETSTYNSTVSHAGNVFLCLVNYLDL